MISIYLSVNQWNAAKGYGRRMQRCIFKLNTNPVLPSAKQPVCQGKGCWPCSTSNAGQDVLTQDVAGFV